MSSSHRPSPLPVLFNPADFYSLATWLLDTCPAHPSPCLVRTIINRAYFAALICARDFTGSNTTGEKGHVNVVNALKNCNKVAANKLNSLRLKRRRADYETGGCFDRRDAQLALDESLVVLIAANGPEFPAKPYSYDFLDPSRFLSTPP